MDALIFENSSPRIVKGKAEETEEETADGTADETSEEAFVESAGETRRHFGFSKSIKQR